MSESASARELEAGPDATVQSPDPVALANVLGEIALDVGTYLRQVFGTSVEVETKNSRSDLVTVHDRIVEQRIRERVAAALPRVRIVGEEGGPSGTLGELVCYVDPIDGTSNFASGVPFYCISLAIADSDRIVAGVVHDPEREETFTATDTASRLNGHPIRTTSAKRDDEALLVASWPYERSEVDPTELADYESALASFRTVRRLGSAALGLAYVAAGRADVTSELIAEPWDVAAGFLLVTSARGRVTRSFASAGEPSWYTPRYVAHGPDFDVLGSSIRRTLTDPITSYPRAIEDPMGRPTD